MTRPITEPSDARTAAGDNWRIVQLERRAGGPWVYVGTYPDDPLTSPESPPFQNGWGNLGGDWTLLRFRWLMDGAVEIEGAVTGGAAGTVIFTLPSSIYTRDADILVPGVDENTNTLAVFLIAASGDVTFVA